MHDAARKWVKHLAKKEISYNTSICEIGSRNVNGSIRYLFPQCSYVGIDISEGPGVDIVADGATWDGDGDKFSVVICCEVLEHVSNPESLCSNMLALLDKDGRIIITAATPEREPHSAIDGGPLRDGEHYRGINPGDLFNWFPNCGFKFGDAPTGDVYAVIHKCK